MLWQIVPLQEESICHQSHSRRRVKQNQSIYFTLLFIIKMHKVMYDAKQGARASAVIRKCSFYWSTFFMLRHKTYSFILSCECLWHFFVPCETLLSSQVSPSHAGKPEIFGFSPCVTERDTTAWETGKGNLLRCSLDGQLPLKESLIFLSWIISFLGATELVCAQTSP